MEAVHAAGKWTTILVFTGRFSGADIYVRVRCAIVGCFWPSRRRKCQAGNFAAQRNHGLNGFHPEGHERRRGHHEGHGLHGCSEIFSLGLTQIGTDDLLRKPGTQESRRGISEIEGKAARWRRASWETSEFQSAEDKPSPCPSCALR
jgi:hypothetical protein